MIHVLTRILKYLMNSYKNNKRLLKNTLFLYLRMFFVLAVTLYVSREILRVLGIEDYGVYNVVAGFVSFFGFLTATLSSSMQRFYNYEGIKHGSLGIQAVYNLGLYIHLLLVVLCVAFMEIGGVWYVNNIMNIPADRVHAALFLLHTCTFSLQLLLLQIPYLGIILAKERMDFYAIVSIIDVALQLLIVLMLPYISFDKLISYGLLLSIISFLKFLMYFVYAYVNFKELRLKKYSDFQLAKKIVSFSGWNLMGTFAYMLKDQGLNMLLNVFFGPSINAARGISFQIKAALSSFSGNITTAFRPQIVNSYAASDFTHTKYLFFVESKLCFALIALLSFPLILNMDSVLRLWLGDNVPTCTNIFSILVLLDLFIGIFNQPCNQIVWATGRLKNYQLANSLVNIFLLPVSCAFLMLGYSAYSVFVLTIIFSAVNQTVCVIFMNKLFDVGLRDYLFRVILPCLTSSILLFLFLYIIELFLDDTFLNIIILCVLELLLSIPIFYLFLLSKSEKQTLLVLVTKFLKNRF